MMMKPSVMYRLIQLLYFSVFQKRKFQVGSIVTFSISMMFKLGQTCWNMICQMKWFKHVSLFQECKFQVGSYIHDATQISFTGTFGHDQRQQRAQQYEIEIHALDESDRVINWANRNFSYTGLEVSQDESCIVGFFSNSTTILNIVHWGDFYERFLCEWNTSST